MFEIENHESVIKPVPFSYSLMNPQAVGLSPGSSIHATPMTIGDLIAFSSVARNIQTRALKESIDLIPESRRQQAVINASMAEIPDVNAMINRTYHGKVFIIERAIRRVLELNNFPPTWGKTPAAERNFALSLDLDDTRELYREIAGRGGFLSPSDQEEANRWKKKFEPPMNNSTTGGGTETVTLPDTQAAP